MGDDRTAFVLTQLPLLSQAMCPAWALSVPVPPGALAFLSLHTGTLISSAARGLLACLRCKYEQRALVYFLLSFSLVACLVITWCPVVTPLTLVRGLERIPETFLF